MTTEEIKLAADQYLEIEATEEQYREKQREFMKAIEQTILSSYQRDIYVEIYKSEYGDYKQFLNEVSMELRNRFIKKSD